MVHDQIIQRSSDQGTARYRWGFVLATMAIAFGGAGWVAIQHYSETVAIDAEVEQAAQPLVTTVTALGRLQPKGDIVHLSAPTSAGSNRVAQLKVKVGDFVQKGQVIAVLDNRDRLQAAVNEAQSQVMIAQTKLAQIKAGAKTGEINAQRAEVDRIEAEVQGNILEQREAIARIEAQYDGDRASQSARLRRLVSTYKTAKNEFERYLNLHQKGAISDSTLESKKLAFDSAKQEIREAEAVLERTQQTAARQLTEANARLNKIQASGRQQLRQAKAALNRVSEVRPVDVQVASAEVERAKAALKQAQVSLKDAYVRSTQDGVILEILTRPGEVIASTGIVQIGQTRQMYAIAEIYQSDIFKIQPGQLAVVTSDSVPEQLHGKVDWVDAKIQRQNVVSADPTDNIDARVVEVHIRLDSESSKKVENLTNLQVKTVIEL